MKIQNSKFKIQNSLIRPPIVVVLGHVDHGKTSLLDYIRKTNVIAKEAGGITQSIGAYEIEHPSAGSGQVKKITFIDTPGHEAFSKMRARGAHVADLGILVVAADDGVKPQTIESIETLKTSQTFFVVAINKIDKPNADVEKIKNDLTARGVLLEGYGGNVSWQAISAKTGSGVNELLDLILLTAELENLTYDSKAPAKGIIIEVKTGSRRGIEAIGIVKDGILKVGDEISTPSAFGKIKLLENFLGKKIKSLSPSSPAVILGFESLPQTGEEFFVGKPEFKKDLIKPQSIEIRPPSELTEKSPILNLILKADVSGSLEILSETVRNLGNKDAKINIMSEEIGEISDSDIRLATSGRAIIVGFKTKINKIAEALAKAQNVRIIVSEIIYELLETIKKEIQLIKTPLPLGELEVLKIFSQKNKKQLVGGRVIFGNIKKNSRLKIYKNNQESGFAKITGLKRQKTEIEEAKKDEECGLMLESETIISEGDRLVWQR